VVSREWSHLRRGCAIEAHLSLFVVSQNQSITDHRFTGMINY
jgi:hypothetical protein